MNADLTLLRCPMTGSSLHVEGDRLVADDGQRGYAIDDGILDLRCHRKDYYFNPVPRPQMAELTQRAGQVPWWRTVRTFMTHVRHNPDWLDNLVADSRYAWKLLLDLPPGAAVLDLGCGLGNLTHSLAPHVGRVYAMDLTIERLRFAKQRFAQFNRDDDIVLVAGGDGARLPFADASLDVVALSGVLEWVADDDATTGGSRWAQALAMALSCFGANSPRAVQSRFLREIRRVLKPEGQLFVAIENRCNQEYLHSRPDHHSGLRYASLLPRFVANLYSIAVNRRPYRTYTYSMGGYRRLLSGAGFGEQTFYGLLPGYSHLAEITPARRAPAFWRPEPAHSAKERVARHPWLVPAYGIVAGAQGPRRDSLLARLLDEIAPQLGGAATVQMRSLRLSGKGKGLLELDAGGARYVAKLPFDPETEAGLAHQGRVLDALCRARPDLEPLLPRYRASGSLQGQPYVVEPKLPGRTLARTPGGLADGSHWLDAAAGLLGKLHRDDAGGGALDHDDIAREVDAPLGRIGAVLEDGRPLERLRDRLRGTLQGARVRRGLVHGDFSTSNLLVDGEHISGLIDWEYARPDGLPILDGINLLDSLHRARVPQATLEDTIAMLAERRWPVASEWAFLMRLYDTLEADPAVHAELACLYWAHHVASQLDAGLVYDAAQIDRRILRVLARIG